MCCTLHTCNGADRQYLHVSADRVMMLGAWRCGQLKHFPSSCALPKGKTKPHPRPASQPIHVSIHQVIWVVEIVCQVAVFLSQH